MLVSQPTTAIKLKYKISGIVNKGCPRGRLKKVATDQRARRNRRKTQQKGMQCMSKALKIKKDES
jgi:hypothetical protein